MGISREQFYNSKKWRDLRKVLVIESKGMCNNCGKTILDTSKLIANHKIALTDDNVTNPSISLNRDNLEIICINCHNQYHQRFMGATKEVLIFAGDDYQSVINSISNYRITSTLFVDEVAMYEAIGVSQHNLKANMISVRNKLYEDIKNRHGSWERAIIILIGSEEYEIQELAQRLGATVHKI